MNTVEAKEVEESFRRTSNKRSAEGRRCQIASNKQRAKLFLLAFEEEEVGNGREREMQAVVAGRFFGPQNVTCVQQRKGSGREIVNGVHTLRFNGGNKRSFVSGDLRLARASSSSSSECRQHRILAFSEVAHRPSP